MFYPGSPYPSIFVGRQRDSYMAKQRRFEITARIAELYAELPDDDRPEGWRFVMLALLRLASTKDRKSDSMAAKSSSSTRSRSDAAKIADTKPRPRSSKKGK